MFSERKHVIGRDPEADLLRQRPAVDTILGALEAFEPSGCFALYGAWGSGKTTVLHTAFHDWGERPKVWFDPWRYAAQGDVLSPFLDEVLDALGVPMPPAERNRFIATLRSISDRRRSTNQTADLKHLRRAFDEILRSAADRAGVDRVLICFDDLDRCLPDTVVSLIEAVKVLLAADGEGLGLFVFALDRHIVGEAIRARFPDASAYTGENYLEKIFDLSFEVPPIPASARLVPFCQAMLAAPEGELDGPFARGLFEVFTRPYLANPRVIRRSMYRLRMLMRAPKVCAAVARHLEASSDRLRKSAVWLAGTERYRTFRHFLRRATPSELSNLALVVNSMRPAGHGIAQHATTPQTDELRRFVNTAGFLHFYQEVFERRDPREECQVSDWATLDDLAEVEPGAALVTIADFDRMMRLVGL